MFCNLSHILKPHFCVHNTFQTNVSEICDIYQQFNIATKPFSVWPERFVAAQRRILPAWLGPPDHADLLQPPGQRGHPAGGRQEPGQTRNEGAHRVRKWIGIGEFFRLKVVQKLQKYCFIQSFKLCNQIWFTKFLKCRIGQSEVEQDLRMRGFYKLILSGKKLGII